MISHAVWKTWPSGLNNEKNLRLRPRLLSTESLGPCFSRGMGDHDQILQHSTKYIKMYQPNKISPKIKHLPHTWPAVYILNCFSHVLNQSEQTLNMFGFYFIAWDLTWSMIVASDAGNFKTLPLPRNAREWSNIVLFGLHCIHKIIHTVHQVLHFVVIWYRLMSYPLVFLAWCWRIRLPQWRPNNPK